MLSTSWDRNGINIIEVVFFFLFLKIASSPRKKYRDIADSVTSKCNSVEEAVKIISISVLRSVFLLPLHPSFPSFLKRQKRRQEKFTRCILRFLFFFFPALPLINVSSRIRSGKKLLSKTCGKEKNSCDRARDSNVGRAWWWCAYKGEVDISSEIFRDLSMKNSAAVTVVEQIFVRLRLAEEYSRSCLRSCRRSMNEDGLNGWTRVGKICSLPIRGASFLIFRIDNSVGKRPWKASLDRFRDCPFYRQFERRISRFRPKKVSIEPKKEKLYATRCIEIHVLTVRLHRVNPWLSVLDRF